MGLLERLIRRAGPRGLPQAPDPTDSPLPQSPVGKPPPREPSLGKQPVGKPPRRDRAYRVKEGDTLRTIARDVYGDETLWTRIAAANRERIGDPPVLYPGLRLDLP